MSTPSDDSDDPLRRAIAQLEEFRADLGDAAVDAAIAALRRHARGAAANDDSSRQRLRQVSVLFADVANSTAMLGRVTAEDAVDLLGKALQSFADAVQLWGGEVLRFTGDGIKAAFGVTGLREDDTERAVRAGLQILDEAAHHAERMQAELRIADFGVRVGIHTGPVLLGGGPEAERGAMGQAVNLAARMEQSAPVGKLRVSEATWAQVRGLFRAEAQPPLYVKGHDEPLQTWLIAGVEAGPEPTVRRGIDDVQPPMVGRDSELARLVALYRRSVELQRVGTALVVGDAGVGKTRLRRELLETLDLHEGDAGLMQARAHPSSTLQPYGVLRQWVARWLGLRDDDPADSVRDKLLQGLAPWLGESAAQQGPRIGQLIGLDFGAHPAVQALSPALLRDQAFAALRDAIHARARATPLLVVLDDLHWADDASLDFVRELVAPAAVPLVVLMLARPSFFERGNAALFPPATGLVELTLAPLDASQGDALVDALLAPLPNPPESLKRLLAGRAEGNPFFLEALVRMLIDDGVIDASRRPWSLRADRLSALRVPPTLVGVLQARLDSLPAHELVALQNASIIGPVFWDDALAALDGAAPSSLPSLQQRVLVVPRGGSAFTHTDERAFSHQMLHDTTYGTVLKAQRREGHARAARWLARRAGDRASEFLAITAEHYERAGDSAQALEYWDLAADDAANRYANESALLFGDRALAQVALTDPRWRFTLLGARYEMLDRLARADETTAACEAMHAWAESCNDDAMRADVQTTRMLRADNAGKPEEARVHAEQAIALARRAASPSAAAAAALAHGELAWLALQRTDFDLARPHIEEGLTEARRAAQVPRRQGGEEAIALKLHAIFVESLNLQNRYTESLQAIDDALLALEGQRRSLAHHRFNFLHRRAIAQRWLGQIEDATATARLTQASANDTGIVRLRLGSLVELTECALATGDHETARHCLDEADAILASEGAARTMLEVIELRGLLARDQRRYDEARDRLQEVLALSVEQGRPYHALQMRCELAWVEQTLGRAMQAGALIDEALADAAQDPRPHRAALLPSSLLACQKVLRERGDPRADELLDDLVARLDLQLASLSDDAARGQLVQGASCWREVHALRLTRTRPTAGR